MTLEFITHPGHSQGNADFSVNRIDLHEGDAGDAQASPVIMLDEFRVRGRPFQPHPHAGFSAVTYVFEDSPAGLRSGDSLGNDIRVGPGGIVWTQAGRGVMHHEVPTHRSRHLHGVQVFVNLSARNKLIEPQTFWLDGPGVPEWTSGQGDRVRVVVGRFGALVSPLTPAEDFTFLDLDMLGGVDLEIRPEQYALLYVASGNAQISSSSPLATLDLASGNAASVRGSGALRITACPSARVLFLAGMALHEPVVRNGPFIMNTHVQITEAARRFQQGHMGYLMPLSKDQS